MKNHPRTRRSRGLTLLELVIVIFVLLSIVSILFVGTEASKHGADRASCVMNIRNFQQATRSYQKLNDLPPGTEFDTAVELIGSNKLIEEAPVCPSAGLYFYADQIPQPGMPAVTCSLGGILEHMPESFIGW